MATYDVGDRSAIVTGGGSGLGEASAGLLAASGAAVLVVDLDGEHAQGVVDRINA
jgi:NAD(P)-dependent dehydrogenase (short-subunit alcohol dehydrogenase family)